MGLNPKKIIKKEVTTDKTTGNVIVTITLSPKKAGEVRTEADHRDAKKIAIEEGYAVGKLVTDCHIENRHSSATGTWEFYPSYATNKITKAPVEEAKPAPKKEEAPKKEAAPKKQFVPKKEPVVEEKKEPEKKSSGFFAQRDKKNKGGK